MRAMISGSFVPTLQPLQCRDERRPSKPRTKTSQAAAATCKDLIARHQSHDPRLDAYEKEPASHLGPVVVRMSSSLPGFIWFTICDSLEKFRLDLVSFLVQCFVRSCRGSGKALGRRAPGSVSRSRQSFADCFSRLLCWELRNTSRGRNQGYQKRSRQYLQQERTV